MHSVKQKLESQYNERDTNFVLQNRIGWQKFSTVRLEQSFEMRERAQTRVTQNGMKDRPHGIKGKVCK